jgi:pimeloyl-ACP methyl ester carboxylesterase
MSLFLLWYIRRATLRKFLLKQFFGPKSYPLSEKEKQYLQDGQRFEIKVNDQTVVYWKWGDGPAVIFAHGWNGRGAQFYRFFDSFINQGFSVIAFDGPGHGESEGKTSSYFQMTDTVRALIIHLKPEKIAGIVGHSFGASAAINALSKEKLNMPVVLIAPAIKLKEILQKTIKTHGVPLLIFKSLVAEYEHKYGYNFENDNPFNLLKTFKLKAFIVHDSDDPVTSAAISRQAANQYESISMITTDGLGHVRNLKDDLVIKKSLDYIITFNTDKFTSLNKEKSYKKEKSKIYAA